MSRSLRAQAWLALALVAGCVILLVTGFDVVWDKIYYERVEFEQHNRRHPIRGSYREARWVSDAERVRYRVAWYLENGFKAWEGEIYPDGRVRHTVWNFDGTVKYQMDGFSVHKSKITEPPWRWGVHDQVRPSAPWPAADSP